MNKIFKNTLIVGGLICAVGLIFTIAGYLLGGNEYVAKADLNKMDGAAMREDRAAIQEKMKIEDIKGFDIDLECVDLKIKPSGDDSCYLGYVMDKRWLSDQDAEPLIWDVTDGVLSMTEAPTKSSIVLIPDIGSLFNGDALEEEKNEVTVYLPEGAALSDSKIHLDSGDAQVSGLVLDRAEIHMEYGDLAMENAVVSDGTIYLEDGDFSLKDSELDTAQIDMEYGDFSFKHGSMNAVSATLSDGDVSLKDIVIAGKCTIDGEYGDVTVKLAPECLQNLAMQLETNYGDVDVDRAIDGAKSAGDETATFTRGLPDAASFLKITLDDGDIVIE